MSVLHMDVPSCTATQQNMVATKEQLEQQVNAVRSAVDGVVGSAWIAPAANQFQGDIQQWAASMTQLLAQFGDLAARLQREIAEWETTGSNVA